MSTTSFLWDEISDNVVAEADEGNNVIATYLTIPSRFGKTLSQLRNGDRHTFHYDGQQSVRQLSDINQDITDSMSYSAYGENIFRLGTTVIPFGYGGAAGYYTDSNTNEIYVRSRTYSPAQSRWLSVDPIAIELKKYRGYIRNVYVYAKNSPANYFDPSGEVCIATGTFNYVSCGGIQWGARFFLEGDAAGEEKFDRGYIIQRVETNFAAYSCPGDERKFGGSAKCDDWFTEDEGEHTTLVYYELISMYDAGPPKYQSGVDFFGTKTSFAPSRGSWEQHGYAWFVPHKDLDDGGDDPPPPGGFDFWEGPDFGGPAGALKYSCEPPPTDPGEQNAPMGRSGSAIWNCCDDLAIRDEICTPKPPKPTVFPNVFELEKSFHTTVKGACGGK